MKNRARQLRKNQTNTERALWQELRSRQVANAKFRRQHIIGKYIVDFVYLEKYLVIEIDGYQHLEQASYDQQRTSYLMKLGFTVIRFWNNEVLSSTSEVLECIYRELNRTPSPQPSPSRERERERERKFKSMNLQISHKRTPLPIDKKNRDTSLETTTHPQNGATKVPSPLRGEG